MARRTISERDATDAAAERVDVDPVEPSDTDVSVEAAIAAVTLDNADDVDDAGDPPVALGSDLPPPVYEPVDRDEWMRQHHAELEAQALLDGDTVTADESTDPLLGPPHPDSTSELLRRPERPARPLRTPIVVKRRRKPRVRRVTRIVRHVDTWSVFKVALVFNAFVLIVLVTSGVLLWQVARATGTVDNVERFFESFGWRSFKLNGGEIFHNAWIAGIFVAIGLTGLAVLAATLFNLITDLVGGIRVTVLEEEVRTRDERIRPLEPPADGEPGGTPVLLAEPVEPGDAAESSDVEFSEPVELSEPADPEVGLDHPLAAAAAEGADHLAEPDDSDPADDVEVPASER